MGLGVENTELQRHESTVKSEEHSLTIIHPQKIPLNHEIDRSVSPDFAKISSEPKTLRKNFKKRDELVIEVENLSRSSEESSVNLVCLTHAEQSSKDGVFSEVAAVPQDRQ